MSIRRPYVESPIIMATVRLVAPFVLTYGLFVTLHGASSPGGGFQGGVIAASVIVMLSFAYGIDPTWEWLDKRVLVGLAAGGIAVFAIVALGPILFGAEFLDLGVYPYVPDPFKYGIELIEVGIGMTVAGVITILFFALSRGAMPPGGEPYPKPSDAPRSAGAARADGSPSNPASDSAPADGTDPSAESIDEPTGTEPATSTDASNAGEQA
ncbi:MnhB domain-containing protein [Halovivax limisalsi]|uniref:MnhB domain-containing protein n=1 Tax=Halovivax limisalsi TaxID=1453760 RepID=UPI001FFC9C7B|nr:MnhB domain-containing protein [Halovivax limisalsi]